MPRFAIISLAVLGLSGCNIYGDDCEDVYYDQAEPQEYRNPDSGQCEIRGGGGGGYYQDCGDRILPANGAAALEPVPDWPECSSHCDGLGEAGCLETDGCQAAYLEDTDCSGDDCTDFYACWTVNPVFVDDTACEELLAYECSARDDCARVHQRAAQNGSGSDPNVGWFVECASEDLEPAWGACSGEVDCAEAGPDCPVGTVAGIKDGCFSGYCIRDDGLGCDAESGDPGKCYGVATCETVAPDCPSNTVPGVEDDCYTGWCIPGNACEAAPACNLLTTEAQCLSVSLCEPFYKGVGCECDGDVCTCESYTFETCADA